jgi:hypothetical protein
VSTKCTNKHENSNRYLDFDLHVAGELQYRRRFLIYLVSFVIFVDEKGF